MNGFSRSAIVPSCTSQASRERHHRMPLLAHDSYGRKLAPLKGKDDKRPVTEAEIEHTHDRIRSHMRSRASSFRENFKRYDRDRSGKIDMHEATEMLMSLNLHNVREKCLHEIFKLADEDNSGEIDYAEFCVLISAEDALPLAKGRKLASELEGGPWLPQGGRNISSLALTLRSSPSLERFNELHMARHLGQTLSKDSLTAHTTIKKLERGKPFDRAMWLERTNFRRQEEALARHQPLVRAPSRDSHTAHTPRAPPRTTANTACRACTVRITTAHMCDHQAAHARGLDPRDHVHRSSVCAPSCAPSHRARSPR